MAADYRLATVDAGVGGFTVFAAGGWANSANHGIGRIFFPTRCNTREYVGQQRPPFAILPDPDRALYQAYGVTGSWAGFAKGALNMLPADFVIDEAGRVPLAFYGNDISEHAAVADIEACLR